MGKLRVFIKSLSRNSDIIELDKKTLVSNLINKVSGIHNIPAQYLRLVYNGKQIMHDQTLETYKIKDGSTIDMSLKLIGGSFAVTGAVTSPDLTAATFTTHAQNMLHNVRVRTEEKIADIRNRYERIKEFVMSMKRFAFMFKSFMTAMFAFFSLVVLVRMIIGFFSKPLEFIMLGIACIVLAVTYVIYFLLSIPYFTIFIPFFVWFILFDLIPLLAYIIVMGALFILITLFCFILWFLNLCTGGALSSLVLCQNSVAAWYKTPNYHLGNKYERGFFCNRACFPGYYPDDTGMFCIKNSAIRTPSYCPQAEAMRLYVGKRKDINYIYKDYRTLGNLSYLSKTPAERENLLKNHFIKKMEFLDKCNKSMKKYDYMPLSICSSLDTIKDMNMNVNDKTLKKLRQVCSQSYCNSKTNYGFCSQLEGPGTEDDSDFWRRAIRLTILIMVFIFAIMFTLCYIAGTPLT
jgi:hypothetical protein